MSTSRNQIETDEGETKLSFWQRLLKIGNGSFVYVLLLGLALLAAVCIIEYQFVRTQQKIDRIRLTLIRNLMTAQNNREEHHKT